MRLELNVPPHIEVKAWTSLGHEVEITDIYVWDGVLHIELGQLEGV